mgnify:CR=1 FL=1
MDAAGNVGFGVTLSNTVKARIISSENSVFRILTQDSRLVSKQDSFPSLTIVKCVIIALGRAEEA